MTRKHLKKSKKIAETDEMMLKYKDHPSMQRFVIAINVLMNIPSCDDSDSSNSVGNTSILGKRQQHE